MICQLGGYNGAKRLPPAVPAVEAFQQFFSDVADLPGPREGDAVVLVLLKLSS